MAEQRKRVVISKTPAVAADAAIRPVQVEAEAPSWRDLIAPCLLTTSLGSTLVWVVADAGAHPWISAGAGALALTALVAVAVLHPLWVFVRRVEAERGRLGEALECLYCHGGFHGDADATVCDREGCGAFYHPECWSACLEHYERCAVLGCGCVEAHTVGPDAVKRHMRRMLIAAALFTPRAVRRLTEQATQSEGLREAYAEAVAKRDALARSPQLTFRVGIVAMALSFLVAMAVIGSADPDFLRSDQFGWVIPVFFFVPAPFMALPFFAYLLGGVLRWLSRLFRGELAALERVDKKGKGDGKE